MDISVVIPTRNRGRHLSRVIQSVIHARIPVGREVELVVVDNGSTDDTRSVVQAAAPQAPFPVRYLYEPVSGAARARNAGWVQAKGDIVAFTDDDCLVDGNWLEILAEWFLHHPGFQGLFGRVEPADGGPVNGATFSVWTSTQARDYRFPCSAFIGGAGNMALRRRALLSVDGFDVAYGPGAVFRGAEEIDLAYRMLKTGAWLRYEPRILVYHVGRQTQRESLEGHRRNAVGLGAYFAKHIFCADRYALKGAWWWWRSTWLAYWKASREGAERVRRVKGIYLRWCFWGALLRLRYLLGRPFRTQGARA